MDLALLLARIILSGVFLVAGVAKLRDLDGSREAMRGFGVPEVLARPFGTVLPIVEIVVGLALLPLASAWWGALGALALLLAFIVGIVASMARGKAPDCHCFGQLHSEPAGPRTLVRNTLLSLVALFVLVAGRTSPGLGLLWWSSDLTPGERTASIVALGSGLATLAVLWVLLVVLRQQGRLVRRLSILESQFASGGTMPTLSLPVGSPAPSFSLPDIEGATVTLASLLERGMPLLLLFWDPGCGPCRMLLPRVVAWQRRNERTFLLVPISRGTVDENREVLAEHPLPGVIIQKDREVSEEYLVQGTPSAVVVRPDGTIGGPLASGKDQIESLIADLNGDLGTSAYAGRPAEAV